LASPLSFRASAFLALIIIITACRAIAAIETPLCLTRLFIDPLSAFSDRNKTFFHSEGALTPFLKGLIDAGGKLVQNEKFLQKISKMAFFS